MKPAIKLFCSLLTVVVLTVGCTGTQTFTTAARPGETVALAVGWQEHLQRQNMTVTITGANGASTIYPPNDTRVRGVVNLYPDPVSKVIVGSQTGQSLGVNAINNANQITGSIAGSTGGTHGDSDWWQTTILLDLPTAIATGQATISIADSAGAVIKTAAVEVLSGASVSNQFNVYANESGGTIDVLGLYPKMLKSMERADHYIVTINTYFDANGNEVVPYSIQAEFTHTAGVGKPWVVNPRGDLKSVAWSDNGTALKVIVTPVNGNTVIAGIDQKFYIAGGITGLTLTSFKAFDVNGNLMAGITPSIQ